MTYPQQPPQRSPWSSPAVIIAIDHFLGSAAFGLAAIVPYMGFIIGIGAALVASDNGGENYAAGGAVAVPGLNPVDNTQDQVQRYLNRVNGQADGDGLYIHWIGGNDLAAAALNAATAPGVAYNSAAAAAAQVDAIDWPQGFCRRDIGWRAL